MPVSVRGVTTQAGSGASIVLSVPAGTVAGDGVFALIVHDGGATIDTPAGWSLLYSVFGSVTLRVLSLNTAVTGGPWTFTISTSGLYAASCVAVAKSGATGATTPVVDVSATSVPASTLGPAVAPTVTPTLDDDLVLSVVGWQRGTTFTPPAGVTEQVDVRSGDGATDRTLWVGSKALTGGTGVATGTTSVTNDNPFGLTAAQYVIATLTFNSAPQLGSWVGDFETGDLSQYNWVERADTDRIEMRTDSPFAGTYYARFTVQDEDVYPLTPTENPRAQINTRRFLFPGMTRWLSWASRFPADFPVIPTGGWLVVSQIHGPPFVGSPQLGLDVDPGDRLALYRNGTYNFDKVWEAPLVRGSWLHFAWRIYFAQDETGWVELYYQGVQQQFTNGLRRLYMRTVEPDQNSGCEWKPCQYRKHAMFQAASLDHDDFRMDTSVPPLLAVTASAAPSVRAVTGSGTTVLARTA